MSRNITIEVCRKEGDAYESLELENKNFCIFDCGSCGVKEYQDLLSDTDITIDRQTIKKSNKNGEYEYEYDFINMKDFATYASEMIECGVNASLYKDVVNFGFESADAVTGIDVITMAEYVAILTNPSKTENVSDEERIQYLYAYVPKYHFLHAVAVSIDNIFAFKKDEYFLKVHISW